MTSTEGPRLVHRDGVLWADVEGEIVLYDTDSGRAHLLSRSGSLLWPAFSEPVSVAELADDVAAVFELSLREALDQIDAFCLQLLEMGALETVDDERCTP